MELVKTEHGASPEDLQAAISHRFIIFADRKPGGAMLALRKLDDLPNKVNREYLEAMVVEKRFFMMDHGKTMICEIQMANGSRERGESNCVDPLAFDRELGYKYSYEDALQKAWDKEGYLLMTLRWIATLNQS